MNLENLKYTKAEIIRSPKFILSRSSIIDLIKKKSNLLSLIDYKIEYTDETNNKIKNISICPDVTLKNISEYLFNLDKRERDYIFNDHKINSVKDILNLLEDMPEFIKMSFAKYLYNYIKNSN